MPIGYYPNQMGLGQLGPNPYAQNQPSRPSAPWQQTARPGGNATGSGGGGYVDPLVQHQNVGLAAGQNPTLAPTPSPWTPPGLPGPMSLADLIGNSFPFQALAYGAQNWQMPGFAQGQQYGGQMQQGGGQQGPTQATSGIQPPQAPPMPQVSPLAAGLAGASPVARTAQSELLPQLLAPQLAALQGQYYTGAADLGLAGQQAQAKSGLDWATLAGQLQQLEQQRALASRGNLLQFLSQGIA